MGDVVVKLFGDGDGYGGATAYETELAMHRLLAGRASMPVPAIIANGDLFDGGDGWRWPYLVQQRIGGTAWRTARFTDAQAANVSEDLGRALAELHRLSPPRGTRFDPGWIQRVRDAANERLRHAGRLPEHLLNQVSAYLEDALPAAVLVHADLTADHVFVDGGQLSGIIDWGDAMLADPYYELIALYFYCFDLNRDLLRTFLYAYRWPLEERFTRRAMQAALSFEFDAFRKVPTRMDLTRMAGWDEVADELFGLH